MVMLSEQQLQEKVLQYEAFISDVLQRDLKKVLEQRDEIYEKIAQYLQLKNIIERLQETGSQELKTQVDLGCNFYVSAEVPDTSTIFIALGYGFFVELTLPEALTFIEKKTKLLNELSETLTKDSARIKANIRMVLESLLKHFPHPCFCELRYNLHDDCLICSFSSCLPSSSFNGKHGFPSSLLQSLMFLL